MTHLGRFFVGIAWLVVAIIPIAAAAVSFRQMFLPSWRGARGRLVECVLAVGSLLFVAQILGAIGSFRPWITAASCGTFGVVATVLVRRRRSRPDDRVAGEPPPQSRTAMVVLMLIAVAFVFVRWGAGTIASVEHGPTDVDTMTYHLPHAAAFVQDASLTRLHYTTADDAIPYHPSNGEALHALGVMAFETDFATPFLNLFWLALALLSVWVLGERFGRAPECVIGACVALATPIMSSTQGGTAMTDIVGLALMLAALAVVVRSETSLVAVAVGGWAAGLALGSKLTMVVAIVALTITLIAAARSEGFRRAPFTAAWFVMLVIGGVFWYIRNLVRAGNPIPSLNLRFGGFGFSKVPMRLLDRYGYSVADYLTNFHVWRRSFIPGLHAAFGFGWFLLLLLAVGSLLVALIRAPSGFVRAGAVSAAMAIAAYIVTPTTALGLRGQPVLFTGNVRYVVPGLLLAIVLLGTVEATSRFVYVGACLFTLAISNLHGWHDLAKATLFGAVVLGIGLVALLRPSLVPPAVSAIVVLALIVGAVTYGGYVRDRYTFAAASEDGSDAVYRWAQHTHDARIGTTGFFITYPLFSSNLSNRVSYVGVLGRDHSFTDATSCAAWKASANAGRFDFIVTLPPFAKRAEPPAASWAEGDPHLKRILHVGKGSVFRVEGRLDPALCPTEGVKAGSGTAVGAPA